MRCLRKIDLLIFNILHKFTTELLESQVALSVLLYGAFLALSKNFHSLTRDALGSSINVTVLSSLLIFSGFVSYWGLLGNGDLRRRSARRFAALLNVALLAFSIFAHISTRAASLAFVLPIWLSSMLVYLRLAAIPKERW